MKGMILAAGYGKRLRPQTDTLPKPLFSLGSTNMIRNAIGYLLSHDIVDIAINIYHLENLIKKELSWGIRNKVNLHLIEEKELMGTAGGIKGAEEFMDGSKFVVINCDVLIDLDLGKLVEAHESKDGLVTLVVRDNPNPAQIGTLAVDTEGRLVRFLDTTIHDYEGKKLFPVLKMFTGLSIYSPDIFGHIPAGRPMNISTELFPKIIEADIPVYTYNHTGYWADIGTPQSYSKARLDAALNKFKTFSI